MTQEDYRVQVQLRSGNRSVVGFVKERVARGDTVLLGGERWEVAAVYATEPADRVAWTFAIRKERA